MQELVFRSRYLSLTPWKPKCIACGFRFSKVQYDPPLLVRGKRGGLAPELAICSLSTSGNSIHSGMEHLAEEIMKNSGENVTRYRSKLAPTTMEAARRH